MHKTLHVSGSLMLMFMIYGFIEALSIPNFTLNSAAFLASVAAFAAFLAFEAETVASGIARFLMNPINLFVISVSFWDVAGVFYSLATVVVVAVIYIGLYRARESLLVMSENEKKAFREGMENARMGGKHFE